MQKNIYGGRDNGLTVPIKEYSSQTLFTAPIANMINKLEKGFIIGKDEVKAAIKLALR